MRNIFSALLILLILSLRSAAQVTPADGAGLNYRIIGFSFPLVNGTDSCRIEIAAGNYSNEEFFQKNIINSVSSKGNRTIAEVPSFGSQYTWRILYNSHSKVTKSELHHFFTIMSPEVNPDSMRLRILLPATGYNDMYVFVDANKTLYDMKGNPLWHLPQVEGIPSRALAPRDIKCTSWGTVTFMMNEQAYEVNYNGDILWKEPEGGFNQKTENERIKSLHHHEFTRLASGHYMTLGMERVTWEVPGKVDSNRVKYKNKIHIDSNGNVQQKLFSGRILEFDKNHNVVWSWDAADYFKNSDLYYRRRPNGLFQVGNTHENAFYFDEKAKVIYVSFRNIHRIVKLQYPSGKVLNTYGQLYIPGNLEMKNDFFCGQHNCRRSRDGYLYLFNNNTCNRLCDQLPTIVMLKEPANAKEQLKKIWEYECSLDEVSKEAQQKLRFETGGSVFELPDRSILCCMAGNYSKVFIVTHDKKVTWSALPEKWDTREGIWKVNGGYRASVVTQKELESLIWGEPIKKQ